MKRIRTDDVQSFVDYAREEGLDYAAQNRTVDDPVVQAVIDEFLDARRKLKKVLGCEYEF